MKKGLFRGVVLTVVVILAVLAFGPKITPTPTRSNFAPGKMITQASNTSLQFQMEAAPEPEAKWWEIWKWGSGNTKSQTANTETAEAVDPSAGNSIPYEESCLPDPERPQYKCIPRDSAGNVGQLGAGIPEENVGLPPLSGFAQSNGR